MYIEVIASQSSAVFLDTLQTPWAIVRRFHDLKFSRFGTIPACERQTDRRTDRQTHNDSIYRASIASRGKKQQVVQEYWRKAKWQGVDIHCKRFNMISTIREHHSAAMQQSRCHAVIEDWMIPFAAYIAAETPDVFLLMGRTTPKIVSSCRGISTTANTWFFGPTWISPQNGISIGLAVLQSSPVCPTHRYTDHATCDVCRRSPHLYNIWDLPAFSLQWVTFSIVIGCMCLPLLRFARAKICIF